MREDLKNAALIAIASELNHVFAYYPVGSEIAKELNLPSQEGFFSDLVAHNDIDFYENIQKKPEEEREKIVPKDMLERLRPEDRADTHFLEYLLCRGLFSAQNFQCHQSTIHQKEINTPPACMIPSGG